MRPLADQKLHWLNQPMFQVLVTDKDAFVREQLAAVINSNTDLSVIATAATAHEAESIIARHKPDVVVVDPRLFESDVDPCELVQQISRNTKCVIHITGARNDQKGFDHQPQRRIVLKQLRGDHLIATIRQLIAGHARCASTTDTANG